ncbi:TetR/AcrR family transcriptional regulator [Ruegeria sediminis]|uniref:TetR/AcrR family transcriptional regulator n=1 Tax=Ruegeria sediminis TaxID=2583820 RepID=A0ABY2WVK2_9RHOB|nr:TetR/AcrR family transcriptional regulator [Ruegeria sediminis]TMV06792.1 TetR/AcrR family transcriptional regulator [Ruegeria sediminis]
MTERPLPTKDRLIRTAAELFQRSGYHGVGLSQLLAAADAPKGSLYHHFPNGKSDLALAAATWASDGMLRLIAASFEPAGSFAEGVETLCRKIAKLFDKSGRWDTCPISATLFEGPDNLSFRSHAYHLYEGWISEVAHHARRLGVTDPAEAADTLFILLQGGWHLARARQDSDVLRSLPGRMRISGAP